MAMSKNTPRRLAMKFAGARKSGGAGRADPAAVNR
jgi:hypothetical protein